jgi:type I restriction enzyme S subunit
MNKGTAGKAGWQIKRLSDFSQAISTGPFGSILHKSDYVGDGIPLVNPINIVNDEIRLDPSMLISEATRRRLSNYVLEEGDIVVGRRGEIGRCAVVGPTEVGFVCGTGSFFVRPLSSIDSKFLAHLLRSDTYRGKLEAAATGTTMKNLSNTALSELIVSIPPLCEQQRIVVILDEAFDGIATAKANAEKNLQYARRVFESAFAALADELDQRSWARTTVADVALAKKGSIRTGPFGSQLLHGEFVEEGIAVLGIDNAVSNEFRWGKRRCITPEKFKRLSRYRVKPGDVLITIMGTCGRCAIVPDDIPTAINTKHLCCITLDPRKCLPSFLHGYFLYHPTAQRFLAEQAKGSVMPGLNMGIIEELPLLLPPLDRQLAIVRRFDALRAQTQRLESTYQQKLAALDALKKSLLHQAFTGVL